MPDNLAAVREGIAELRKLRANALRDQLSALTWQLAAYRAGPALHDLLEALLAEREAWRQLEEQRRGAVAGLDSKEKRQACQAHRAAKDRTEATIARLLEVGNA